MQNFSEAQKSRGAVATFKTLADALVLQGLYKPKSAAGKALMESLRQLSPEIYGSMNNSRVVELKGLEYVFDRMPRGLERCRKLVLTAHDDFKDARFEMRIPLKRRRISYAVSEDEICFIITRGVSEVYDLMTHVVFLNNEAEKIYNQIHDLDGEVCGDWLEFESFMQLGREPDEVELDKAIWNVSKILGRSYQETRESYLYLEKNRQEKNANSGLFEIVYSIGRNVFCEKRAGSCFEVHFTPSLNDMIRHHEYAVEWAVSVKKQLLEKGWEKRPLHIISANMHSFRNLLYGAGYLSHLKRRVPADIYEMVREVRGESKALTAYAEERGFVEFNDTSGSNIDVHLIDTAGLEVLHPELDFIKTSALKPVLLVHDYAFGTQAFKIMDELLGKQEVLDDLMLNIQSISVMGKAGILDGQKGDIMLATAHVLEGTANNYIVHNDFEKEDFDEAKSIKIVRGTMLTVLGTSLQNSALLGRFLKSEWKVVGLEMEGGHYQRAISAAIIQERIPQDLKVRYAYYASDNPLISGQTLASGPMGEEGLVPTYLISKVILQKIFV